MDLEGHQDPRGTKVSPPLYAYPHPGRVGGGPLRGGKPHFLKAPVKIQRQRLRRCEFPQNGSHAGASAKNRGVALPISGAVFTS